MTDIEIFQETLAASGLPPTLSKRHDSGEFRASIAALDLGQLKLVELVTPEGECFRDARCIRAADEQHWQIDLVTRGWARVEQGGGVAELGPSDMVLIDPERPVRFASTDCTHVTMLAPRETLRLRSGEVPPVARSVGYLAVAGSGSAASAAG